MGRIPWNKKSNIYDLSGEYGVGWTSNTNEEFYFDLEDYDKIKDCCWSKGKNGYAIANIDGKNKTMHGVLCEFKNVDHKNRNRLDNRKENLRKATTTQQAQNRGLQSNNTSGVVGIYYRKERNAWFAQITVNGKTKTIKYSHNKEEAIRARLEAEKNILENLLLNNIYLKNITYLWRYNYA